MDQLLGEYLSAIHEVSRVGIDCCTNDNEKVIEQIAQTAGFSKNTLPKLATGFYSVYEDCDTGRDIMLPSITVKIEKKRVQHVVFPDPRYYCDYNPQR